MKKGSHIYRTATGIRAFSLDASTVSVTDTRGSVILEVVYRTTVRKCLFVRVRRALSWVISIGADDLSQPEARVTYGESSLGCCYVLTWTLE